MQNKKKRSQQMDLSNCTSGGCGAKIGPDELKEVLNKIPTFSNENLLVGYDSSDDGAVYQVAADTAIISTLDFFSPMVEEPLVFGKIAAANALSDVYAMGGEPLFALNMVCFPEKADKKMLEKILQGGAQKIREAGAVLCGGHSIYDKEIKYGLSVTGKVQPNKILRNNTCQKGDVLILTKSLGVGIIMAAHRGGLASGEALKQAIYSMERLNKYAVEAFGDAEIHACTDITGFGLLAHVGEMAGASCSIQLDIGQIPYIPEAYDYAAEYLLTAAGQRNRKHMKEKVEVDKISFPMQELMFDPQTSGGLLLSVAEADAKHLLKRIKQTEPNAKIIGHVVEKGDKLITFG